MDQNLQAVLFWQHHQTTTPFIPHTGVAAAAAAADGPLVGDPGPKGHPGPLGPSGEPWEKKEEEEKEENNEEEEDDGKKY